MARGFVRIPLGKQLSFPKFCPFTGTANPRKSVTVRHPRFRWRVPIPILGSLWSQPTTRVRFPASPLKVNIDLALKVMMGMAAACIIGAVLLHRFADAFRDDMPPVPAGQSRNYDSGLGKILLVALGVYFICKILSIINLRAVQIIEREGGVVEVSFNHVDYARELSARNELICHDLPFKKRRARRL
jgi:hypothetical protein